MRSIDFVSRNATTLRNGSRSPHVPVRLDTFIAARALKSSQMSPLSEEELRAVAMRVGPPRGGNRRYLALDVEAVRQLLSLGYSYSQVGEVFHCSRETIRRRLNGR